MAHGTSGEQKETKMATVNKAVHLRGTTVTIYERTELGKDELNRPVYEETPVEVSNVLIGNPDEQEIIDVLNLTGRKVTYVLGIPKGDAHDWTDRKVTFFGKEFRTIGDAIEGIEEMIPLEWNRKVRCERING